MTFVPNEIGLFASIFRTAIARLSEMLELTLASELN
jgi:hypothetical protein